MNRSFVIAAGAMLLAGGVAQAGLQIDGDIPNSAEMTGTNFLADLSYAFDAGTMGTLTIDPNTTPGGIGGFLTAFVFSFASIDPTASAALTSSTDADFGDLAGASASPFGGPFIGGAGTGGGFEGGGPPSAGIAVGGTETFTFKITAGDAAALTDESFGIAGPEDFNFVVRFRGLNDGGSDKVPGKQVPTPGAMTLLAGAGLMASRRRRG